MNDRDELGRLRAALAQSEQEQERLRMFLDRIARGDGGGAFCKCGDIAIAALAGSSAADPTRPDMAKVNEAMKGMQDAFRSLTPEQQSSLNESWCAGTVIGSPVGNTADYAPAAKIKESPVMPAYREALRALNETRAALEQVTAERDANLSELKTMTAMWNGLRSKIKELRAELEQVTAERDAALEDGVRNSNAMSLVLREQLAAIAERDAAHAREVVLREALEIFADRDNWGMDNKFLHDEFGILIADAALKGGAK